MPVFPFRPQTDVTEQVTAATLTGMDPSASHSDTRAFYDRISSVYDLIADAGEHAARDKGLQLLHVQPGERILEIGYGTGQALVDLAEAAGPEGHIDGIDVSSGMHEVASKRLAEAGLADRVTIRTGSVPPLPWPDDQFDGVFMSFVLELFPEAEMKEVLSETFRVLRPQGRLSVVSMATVQEGEHDSLLEKTYKWLHRHFPHIIDCRPIDAAEVIRSAGFCSVQEERLEIWTLPVAAVTARTPAS